MKKRCNVGKVGRRKEEEMVEEIKRDKKSERCRRMRDESIGRARGRGRDEGRREGEVI